MDKHTCTGNFGGRIRSDCSICLELSSGGGIDIQLESKVESMFGAQIRAQLEQQLLGHGIRNAKVEVKDSGALEFVLAARLEAAVKRLVPDASPVIPELISQNIYDSSPGRSRFSRLYLPGNSPSMMLNAGIHQPDGIILDLEDSVAPDRKDEARILVRNALCQVDFYGAERMVRINQLPAGLEDLDFVVPHHVHLILIPKCESALQVREVNDRIAEIQKACSQDREIFLMPILESCLGVEHAFEIACAAGNVVAMAIGLEDFTADLGVPRTAGGEESLFARMRMVNACKAAGIQPIDSVFSDVADMEGLRRNVMNSRALGFEGMGCIHPRQVPVIQEAFCPTKEEIDRAKLIIEAFEEAESKGLGVIAVGSKMIDPPVVRRAQKTMELARRFSKVK